MKKYVIDVMLGGKIIRSEVIVSPLTIEVLREIYTDDGAYSYNINIYEEV